MLRNFFFILDVALAGFWIVWPEITTLKGWDCVSDISSSRNDELTDYESFVEALPNKIKLGLSLSPKAILKRKNLSTMDKFRIVGDTCFR